MIHGANQVLKNESFDLLMITLHIGKMIFFNFKICRIPNCKPYQNSTDSQRNSCNVKVRNPTTIMSTQK